MSKSSRQSAVGYRPWQTPQHRAGGSVGEKTPKVAAHYTPDGTAHEHCSICQHYILPRDRLHQPRCTEVTGEISPKGWCRFFHRE